jgi:excisionase family DNA binding protein
MPLEPLFVSPDEAARILNFSRKTIYRMLKAKDLPFTRVGRQIRIPKRALSENSFGQKRFHPTK